MVYQEFNGLSKYISHQLAVLVEKSFQIDMAPPKIYWNIIREKRALPSDLCCFKDNQLIAYLGFFLFNSDEAEISAVVDPYQRQQGLFRKLFNRTIEQLSRYRINRYTFPCATQSLATKQCLISLGSKFDHVEYRMTYSANCTDNHIEKPRLKLRKATLNDTALLANIDSVCFNNEYSITLERFHSAIKARNRIAWVAYLDDKCIGKIHVRFDPNALFLHDICIIPGQQGKGYGTEMMKLALNKLSKYKHRTIWLEVEADNGSAIQAYKKCSFEISVAYEYWKLNYNNK
jgi:ribosomal protein S18 acetylase RimI-like enzyme